MTGVVVDTMLICTVTGLAICCSGVLDSGAEGAALTILAFRTVLGPLGGVFVSVAVVLFAFSTILGGSIKGKAFEYLSRGRGMASTGERFCWRSIGEPGSGRRRCFSFRTSATP